MKTKIGMSFGLAMMLTVGVIATMLALGMFTTSQVDAAPSAGTLSGATMTVVHTPDDPGDAAKVTVKFTTVAALVGGQDTIVIEFEDDVKFPATLDRTAITMSASLMTSTKSGGATGNQVANPLGVTVQYIGTPADEPLVTLDIPDMDPDTQNNTGSQGIAAGAVVTITFRQSAGITNPTEAGSYEVKIETTNDSAGSRVTSSTGQTINRIIELSSKDGDRGKSVTVTGKGFKNSTTATVWLDNSTTGTRESTEPVLCTAKVASDDTFSCSFTVGETFATSNTINAVDGRNQVTTSGKEGSWTLKGKITAVPDSAAVGDTVTIELRDYPASVTVSAPSAGTSSQDGDSDLDVFTLGGVEIEGPAFSTDSSGDASFVITIPDNVELGSQSLDMDITTSGTRRDTMTILGAQLEVEPTAVVPNQSVTVTGRGFSKSQSIDSDVSGSPAQMLIGGEEIKTAKIDDGDLVSIDSGGNWVATVVMPVYSPSTAPGDYEFKVVDDQGRPGVANVTIAGRTISFSPEESRIGTILTITGAGWPAVNTLGDYNASLTVDYTLAGATTAATSATVIPDSDGNFTATLKVPNSAVIPSTNRVTVSYTPESNNSGVTESDVSEVAAHRVPGADITISPISGPGGTVATLTGEGFKSFTTLTALTVGGTTVEPKPSGPSVDKNGILESSEVLIPGLDAGTHTVKATVGGTVVSVGFTVTADAVVTTAASLSAEQTTAEAFASVIDNDDNLVGVFSFDNATQTWTSYDPDPDFADFNDLDTVSGGNIVWVRVLKAQDFNGQALVDGWNQIVLP